MLAIKLLFGKVCANYHRRKWAFPIIYKLCGKMSNYLIKCPYFLIKLSFVENLISLKSIYEYTFKWNSTLAISSSTYNPILLKSSFKNNDILLNNFKTEAFCCIIYKLGTNVRFSPSFTLNPDLTLLLWLTLFSLNEMELWWTKKK